MLFKSKKVLGLDIGTSTIKIAEMNVSKSGATLESFAFLPTPTNSIISGEIADVSGVAGVVHTLIKDLKTKRKHISTGMWGTAVIVKKFSIPKSEQKTIKDQLAFYAEQYIPFDITNITLAYTFLKAVSEPGMVDVLLIGAQNELVSQYLQVVSSIGLKCSILDVSGFALANCFEMNYGRLFNENIGILNFGSSITNFVVLQNGEVVFCRDIPVGGNNFTSEIHKTMGVTLQEAETLKMSAVTKKEVPEDVNTVINTTNEMITEEIRNSLDFLSATTNNMTLNRFFYTGGSSQIPGLIDSVHKGTNVPLEVFNPFQRIKINQKKINPTYLKQIKNFASVAIGLGIRSVGDS